MLLDQCGYLALGQGWLKRFSQSIPQSAIFPDNVLSLFERLALAVPKAPDELIVPSSNEA
jgi:hypothetical protein